MNGNLDIPEFGERIPGKVYVPRPGAYGIIVGNQGRIAVMKTPRGGFLPGGGSEGCETPEETLVREVREECGFEADIVKRIGEAVDYVFTAGNREGIRKECVFFLAIVLGSEGAATEADHVLTWLEPEAARAKLIQGSQQWAVLEATNARNYSSPFESC